MKKAKKKLSFDFQTRRNDGSLKFFATLDLAMKDAEDLEVWKVSFSLPTGERVRLVRMDPMTGDSRWKLDRIKLDL